MDTFSLIAKLTTIRTLLTITVVKGWFLHQLYSDNAFLHGDLHKEVYVKLPPGPPSTYENHVCKLKKNLYGLKQASRQ